MRRLVGQAGSSKECANTAGSAPTPEHSRSGLDVPGLLLGAQIGQYAKRPPGALPQRPRDFVREPKNNVGHRAMPVLWRSAGRQVLVRRPEEEIVIAPGTSRCTAVASPAPGRAPLVVGTEISPKKCRSISIASPRGPTALAVARIRVGQRRLGRKGMKPDGVEPRFRGKSPGPAGRLCWRTPRFALAKRRDLNRVVALHRTPPAARPRSPTGEIPSARETPGSRKPRREWHAASYRRSRGSCRSFEQEAVGVPPSSGSAKPGGRTRGRCRPSPARSRFPASGCPSRPGYFASSCARIARGRGLGRNHDPDRRAPAFLCPREPRRGQQGRRRGSGC